MVAFEESRVERGTNKGFYFSICAFLSILNILITFFYVCGII